MIYRQNISARYFLAALTTAVIFMVTSCNDIEKEVQPKISISQIKAGQTSVQFKLTPEDASYYEYSITVQEDNQTIISEETGGSSERVITREGLTPGTTYIIKATAYNGNLSMSAQENFQTEEEVPDPQPEPKLQIENVSADFDSITFELQSTEATKVFWTVYEGKEMPEDIKYTEENAAQIIECTKEGLKAETEYTISAYAANGDVKSEIVSYSIVTLQAPIANDYLTIEIGAAARNLYIEVKCHNLEGRKFYCNVFSPKTAVWDYDTSSEYYVDSKENFLKYVISEQNYLDWAALYGDTDKSLWADSDSQGNSITPGEEYIVYAITFTEGNDSFDFDQSSILEAKVTTSSGDIIGEGNAILDFTITAGSDYAKVEFSDPESVVAYAYGYVRKDEADKTGGITEFVKDQMNSGNLYFRDLSYFDTERTERPLSPDTKYYYYTICYGKDGKLGNITYKEFKTTDITFSPDYTCNIVLDKMYETEVKFKMESENCSKGRWCNITKEEFEDYYSGDINKVAKDKLLSDRAEQIFTDSAVYVYSLETGKDYVFIVLPLGGDMGEIYGTPAMMEYKFN